jgi:hypothetical protein
MINSRIADALLLIGGLVLLGWGTMASTRPDPVDHAPSVVMAAQSQGVLEGRSVAR